MSARTAAAEVLLRTLVDGQSLAAASSTFAALADPRERALARELAYGTVRFHARLRAVVASLVERPLRRRDADVEMHLLIGLYQLLYLRVPPHAAVSEAVAAAGRHKPWARGIVNGVLRRFERERDAVMARVDADEGQAHAHPGWMIEAFRSAWPDDWQQVIAAGNQRPPMGLRVNGARMDRDAYREVLAEAGVPASDIPGTSHGLVLGEPRDVAALPGFDRGDVSVQDGAAQLAAPLLDARPGHRILDACAAPGGKTAHLAELTRGAAEIVAIDVDAGRLATLRAGLTRLGLDVTALDADARATSAWWDGRPFDRILLDAPCSATGVIRRHPDIKVHRRRTDLESLCVTQGELLESLWPLLARSGRLLYATCSVLPQENAARVDAFLTRNPGARALPLPATWGRAVAIGRQILPGDDGMDGFYYALLAKS